VNIALNDIPLKTRFFGLHKYRRIFNHFFVIGPKATEFSKILQNTQPSGHSRSPILVLIESPHATSY